ncbi:MAG: cell division protein SepF [Corynebacterium nuruki]|jgi:cell division inhibitor SepF|nr:cell division protein SepF [Corynebacterium nuruki]
MAEGITGKMKDFFGLGSVDSYEDPYHYDEFDDDRDDRDRRDHREPAEDPRDAHAVREPRETREARPAGRYGAPAREPEEAYRRPEAASRYEGEDRHPRSGLYSATTPATPASVEPRFVVVKISEFREAGNLANAFRTGDVVAFSLSGMEKAEATRVLDFSAGLAKGLAGDLKKLGGFRSFVLVPADVTLDRGHLDDLDAKLAGDR